MWDTLVDDETRAVLFAKAEQSLPTGKVGQPVDIAQ